MVTRAVSEEPRVGVDLPAGVELDVLGRTGGADQGGWVLTRRMVEEVRIPKAEFEVEIIASRRKNDGRSGDRSLSVEVKSAPGQNIVRTPKHKAPVVRTNVVKRGTHWTDRVVS